MQLGGLMQWICKYEQSPQSTKTVIAHTEPVYVDLVKRSGIFIQNSNKFTHYRQLKMKTKYIKKQLTVHQFSYLLQLIVFIN